MKNAQEDHGVHAAGDGHEDFLPAGEQPVVPDFAFNALEQIGHPLMLLHGQGGASVPGQGAFNAALPPGKIPKAAVRSNSSRST